HLVVRAPGGVAREPAPCDPDVPGRVHRGGGLPELAGGRAIPRRARAGDRPHVSALHLLYGDRSSDGSIDTARPYHRRRPRRRGGNGAAALRAGDRATLRAVHGGATRAGHRSGAAARGLLGASANEAVTETVPDVRCPRGA